MANYLHFYQKIIQIRSTASEFDLLIAPEFDLLTASDPRPSDGVATEFDLLAIATTVLDHPTATGHPTRIASNKDHKPESKTPRNTMMVKEMTAVRRRLT